MHPSPQSQAIEAVREFVKEAGGAAARELSPAERRDVMDVILQPYLEAEASAKWEWRDYDRKQHTVNIEKRFANRGAPPSNEVRVQATHPHVPPSSASVQRHCTIGCVCVCVCGSICMYASGYG